MKRLISWFLVLSLIVGSFVFVPLRGAQAEDSNVVVKKWADVPEGAFLLRFEKNYTGVSTSDAPLYVATKQGDNTVIYKIPKEGSDYQKVLTVNGTYSFFDFDPAYKGYMFVLYGEQNYGNTIDIYQNGKYINRYTSKGHLFGIGHWKNYIAFGSTSGINHILWVNGGWKTYTILKYGSLTKSWWFDDGLYFSGFGEIGWYKDGKAYGIETLGEGNVEALFENEGEIYIVYVDLSNAFRVVYKISGNSKEKLFALDNIPVNAFYKMGGEWVIYRKNSLYRWVNDKLLEIASSVISPIFHDGKIWFIGKDGIYTVSMEEPLQVSAKAENFEMDLVDVGKKVPAVSFVSKENQNVDVSCQSDKPWLKPSQTTLTLKAEGGEAEKLEFSVDLDYLKKNYPDTPTVGATVSCQMKTSDGKKSKSLSFRYTLKLPQIGFDPSKTTITGTPAGSEEFFVLGYLYNNGAGTGTVRCAMSEDWGDVITDSEEVLPGKTAPVKLMVYPDKAKKENHGTLVCSYIGGTIKQDITFIRSDMPNVNVIFDRGKGNTDEGIEYRALNNWRGSLGIENNENATVSVECSANVDWLLPDIWPVKVPSGSVKKVVVMPRVSRLQMHWPTQPSVYGGYHCTLSVNGKTVEVDTEKLRVKLPQLKFKNIAGYDVKVSNSNTEVNLISVENKGDGIGMLTCTVDKPWVKLQYDHDVAYNVITNVRGIFDYDSMLQNGLVSVTCKWEGGEEKFSFNVIKEKESTLKLSIIRDTLPLADVLGDGATIAIVSLQGSGSYPVSVSADKPFVKVQYAENVMEELDSAVIVSIDREKITREDISLPYITFNLTINYGDKSQVVPVKVQIKRALVLSVPKNRLDYGYKLWTPEDEWQKLTSPDSAPFINPLYNRTYVPLRLVSEGLGLKVGWDGKNRIISIESEKVIIQLDVKKVVKKKAKIMGKYEYIYESTNRYARIYAKMSGTTGYGRSVYVYPTVIWRNRSYVPVRFIAEQVKSLVFWDGKTRTVWIYR